MSYEFESIFLLLLQSDLLFVAIALIILFLTMCLILFSSSFIISSVVYFVYKKVKIKNKQTIFIPLIIFAGLFLLSYLIKYFNVSISNFIFNYFFSFSYYLKPTFLALIFTSVFLFYEKIYKTLAKKTPKMFYSILILIFSIFFTGSVFIWQDPNIFDPFHQHEIVYNPSDFLFENFVLRDSVSDPFQIYISVLFIALLVFGIFFTWFYLFKINDSSKKLGLLAFLFYSFISILSIFLFPAIFLAVISYYVYRKYGKETGDEKQGILKMLLCVVLFAILSFILKATGILAFKFLALGNSLFLLLLTLIFLLGFFILKFAYEKLTKEKISDTGEIHLLGTISAISPFSIAYIGHGHYIKNDYLKSLTNSIMGHDIQFSSSVEFLLLVFISFLIVGFIIFTIYFLYRKIKNKET